MTIFITGASSGIGFATADLLLSIGHDLVLLGRTPESIQSAEQRLRTKYPEGKFLFLQADITQLADRERIRGALEEKNEKLSAIVHSAGIFEEGSLFTDEQEAFDRMYEVNLRAMMELDRLLFPYFKQPGGRIVIVGSTAGLEPHKKPNGESVGQAYSVTKYATRGYAYNLREEGKAKGIGVTLVSPGSVFTEMWEGTELPPDVFSKPQDVAEAIKLALHVSSQSVIEEIVLRPLNGNV